MRGGYAFAFCFAFERRCRAGFNRLWEGRAKTVVVVRVMSGGSCGEDAAPKSPKVVLRGPVGQCLIECDRRANLWHVGLAAQLCCVLQLLFFWGGSKDVFRPGWQST